MNNNLSYPYSGPERSDYPEDFEGHFFEDFDDYVDSVDEEMYRMYKTQFGA